MCVYIKKNTYKKRMSKIKSFELIERSNLWVITISNEIRYTCVIFTIMALRKRGLGSNNVLCSVQVIIFILFYICVFHSIARSEL